jgi:hypothetical protein
MRDMTSERFALVKTSNIRRLAVVSGECKTPFHFIRLMRVHPVVKPAPCGVAAIQFLQFTRIRPTPRFGGKIFSHSRDIRFPHLHNDQDIGWKDFPILTPFTSLA